MQPRERPRARFAGTGAPPAPAGTTWPAAVT